MSDSFAERLSGLTPDAAGFDRDAVLIAAGRASARPSRLWQIMAAALALSQVVTLAVLLWPRPASPAVTPAARSIPAEAPLYAPAGPADLAALSRQRLEPGNGEATETVSDLVPPDPPLRAGSVSSVLLLD
jgi:hypothetical protein